MNENELQLDSLEAFLACIISGSSLLLFQIPTVTRIIRVRKDTSSSSARFVSYGIFSSVLGLCLAEASKATIFSMYRLNNAEAFKTA
jgi:hypothetical protein